MSVHTGSGQLPPGFWGPPVPPPECPGTPGSTRSRYSDVAADQPERNIPVNFAPPGAALQPRRTALALKAPREHSLPQQ